MCMGRRILIPSGPQEIAELGCSSTQGRQRGEDGGGDGL